MLEERNYGATVMTASHFASSAASVAHEPCADSIFADAALIAELALTFDLDALVTEGQIDPFRR